MKNFITLSIILFLFNALISCSGGDNTDNKNSKDSVQTPPAVVSEKPVSEPTGASSGKKYAIKSGIVKYKMQMSTMKQNMTLYFDDNGSKEVSEIQGDMMGQKIHNRTINKDGFIYNIDLIRKTGVKMNLSSMPMGGNLDFSKMDAKQLADMKIKKESNTETFLGKTCDIYTIDNTQLKGTFLVWQNLMLRTKASASGVEVITEATEIQENADVPAEKFEIPADIKIQEK